VVEPHPIHERIELVSGDGTVLDVHLDVVQLGAIFDLTRRDQVLVDEQGELGARRRIGVELAEDQRG
jgi:hypothetical protein